MSGDNGRGDRLQQYRWQPGESGNPAGRPVGSVSLPTLLRKHAEQLAGEVPYARKLADELGLDPSESTVADVVVRALVKRAIEGASSQSERLCWEYLAGAVPQKIEHTDGDGLASRKAALQAILSDPEAVEHIQALEDRLRAVQMGVSVQST